MQITSRSKVIGWIPRPETRGAGGESLSARSSVKPSSAANDNLIDRTIELWQPRLRRELNPEDARQIVENVTGFFSILAEWSRGEATTPANDIGDQTDHSNTGEVRHES